MAEQIIFPSEVLPEINWEKSFNPVSATLCESLTPNDIVTGQAITVGAGAVSENGGINCNTATVSPVITMPSNPLTSLESGAMVIVLDVISGDHFSHTTFSTFVSDSSQRYFIFGYNRDRKKFYISVRNGASSSGDFVTPTITNNTDFHGERVFVIGWERFADRTTFTLTTKFDSSTFDLITTNTLWAGVSQAAFNKTGINVKCFYAVTEALTNTQLTSLADNPYQTFKTREIVEQEYGLKLTTASESISIPFVGAYDINLTDSDDVVTNYTGSGTFTLTGTVPVFIKLIAGTHDNGYEVFDFNQTSGNEVTSHTSTLICTIVGTTSGFIPIVPKHILSLGTGKDFETYPDWVAARKSVVDARQCGVVYGALSGSGNNHITNGKFPNGGELVAASGYEWDIHGTNANYAKIPNTIFAYDARLTFRRIEVTANSMAYCELYDSHITNATSFTRAKRCLLNGIYGSSLSSEINIDDSIIYGRMQNNTTTTLSLTNCLVPYSAAIHLLEAHYSTGKCIFRNTWLAGNEALVNDMVHSTVQESVDMSAWFDDADNGKYSLTEAGQTATKGKGWNNSDVASWAYYVVVEAGGTEQTIVVSSTEQLTQSQLVNILGIGAINAIVSEQKTQSQLVSVTEINQLNAITSEQKTQSTLIDVSEINHVSAIVCEQLTQSVLVAVTANGAQSVNVIITEQKTQSELVSIDEVANINAITSEQLTQSELVSISAIANINSIICEQVTQSNIQQISVDVTIDAIICEQLTQSQLITIIQSNIADALNIDIDQITIEMLTPKHKIEMLTPKYTIEHIH